MSRWFRHYVGMMRDEKLVSVAVKSKQPVERVAWVWGAILESAAEINDGGRYEFDAGEAAYFLRCDESELAGIAQCLEDSGRVLGGVVVRWDDRQFNSDSSKERQRRYRERQKARTGCQERDNHVGKSSRDVTRPSRDGDVTLQDTETETYKDVGSNEPTSPEAAKAAPVAVIFLPTVSEGDFPIFESDVAEWEIAYPAVDVRQQLHAMRAWLIANPKNRKTSKGMRRFVNSWLDRKQNSAHRVDAPRMTGPPPRRQNPVEAYQSIWNELDEPTGVSSNHGDAELLPPDGSRLLRIVADAGQAVRWPK